LSDPTAATPGLPPTTPSPKYKRRLSNYLLDKKLQLRYILVVTILSGVIAGALGFLIYQQNRAASESIEEDLKVLMQKSSADGFEEEIASDLESGDRALIYKMALIGVGLVVILSMYLLIMTHRVAGPLFKISMYFDRMAEGKLGTVTPLRERDMLQDFYVTFKAMHETVRSRAAADADTMESAVKRLREGAAGAKLTAELDALEQHVAQLRKQIAG
jgi:nitrogen fixation/metabolism regulation signal transduction histidine kinase